MTSTNKKSPPILDPERIQFVKKIESKKCVFDALTALLIKGQKEVTKNEVFDALIKREKLGSTSIGNGFSVPKGHLPITNPRAAILVVKKGINLGSADKQVTKYFIAILLPEEHRDQYNDMLRELNKALMLKGVPKSIIDSKNTELLAKHFDDLLYDESLSIIADDDRKQIKDSDTKNSKKEIE